MMINQKQKRLLQHMLGADSRYKKKQWGFRNRFCAGDDDSHPDNVELNDLQDKGLVKSYMKFGYKTFYATKEGAEQIGFGKAELKRAEII
jgi:hypothetical protein